MKNVGSAELAEIILPNGETFLQINEHETKFLYDEIYKEQVYLKHIPELRNDATIVDVGANIGLFTNFFATRKPAARMLCFEPAPHCLVALRRNVARFGDRVLIIDEGLGDREDTARFTYYPNYTIMSSFFAEGERDKSLLKRAAQQQLRQRGLDNVDERMLEALVGNKVGAAKTFDCRLNTLSHHVRKLGIDCIDLLKVDVERAELAVLAGIESWLWPRIGSVIVEVHDEGGGELKQVEELLKYHGFITKVEEEEKLLKSGVYVVFAWHESGTPRSGGG